MWKAHGALFMMMKRLIQFKIVKTMILKSDNFLPSATIVAISTNEIPVICKQAREKTENSIILTSN